MEQSNYLLVAEAGEYKLLTEQLHATIQNGIVILPDNTQWRLVLTGVGAINIIHTLRDLPRSAKYLNVGYAGSANYEIGTLVAVNEVHLLHPQVQYQEPQLLLETPPITCPIISPCYTSTDFVRQSDYHNCVFDMELAFICAMGLQDVSAIKYVSDNLSKHQYDATNRGS